MERPLPGRGAVRGQLRPRVTAVLCLCVLMTQAGAAEDGETGGTFLKSPRPLHSHTSCRILPEVLVQDSSTSYTELMR